MTKQIDLNKYQQFVEAVTSQPSNDLTSFINRLDELDGNFDASTQTHGPDINVPLLLTAALGLAAETGEFCEIPKKMFFQGNTLLGFDTVKSEVKTVRKPAETIKEIMGSKPAARKFFAELKTVATVPNGRFNDNMVILKAW